MSNKVITIAAAIILNEQNQILLVRKKDTDFFMHVGGKLEPNELPEAALSREVLEETGCEMEILSYISKYETVAANELNHSLVSYLYQVKLKSQPQVQAELAEMQWVDLNHPDLPLAPLTRDISIPWCKQLLGI
ncbi:NUDIX domain-containing protein [Acinetobacter variabilis]|uniref:NUDIX hydrolase n=1 Tax=Acinetobacter variabilis TaxID=70346 RepID=UPI0021D20176|nr:NUDIX domain-containing protein [Acinetobacter variabilis]MCU4630944.1 NUDIX domain-containing protein [Acinetobacter variabilis]